MANTLEGMRARLRRLGDAARVAEDHAADAREARDQAIEQAEVDGLGVRQIAKDTGLSPGRVQAIVIERTAARHNRQARAVGFGPGPT